LNSVYVKNFYFSRKNIKNLIKVFISVTNDIVTDRRVGKVALSLLKLGFKVNIIGRRRKNSLPLQENPYKSRRFRLLFNKGPLFYAEHNIRIFLYLILRKVDILVANDLDTLPANYLVSKIRRKKLVYDSHEYFTEVPELENRKFVKRIWTKLEKAMLPKIKYSYTVCDSIAGIYSNKYGINMQVIRNLPVYNVSSPKKTNSIRVKNERIIIYQGVLNVGRGLELAIQAMKFVDNTALIIIGDGDIASKLKTQVCDSGLEDKVRFIERVPYDKLMSYAVQADIGISLEENLGLNYYYALPNKLFDYIHAGIPVLVSDFPEMAGIVKKYNVGLTTDTTEPLQLASLLREMIENEEKRKEWKQNLKKAAKELCWEIEEKKLLELYSEVIAK
jgi:glycosyltransferase involved in cell wall biosynthesis